MRDAFARTLYEIARERRNVFIVVADISPVGSMAQFRQEFPDRFINVGVAEQSMIGICAGLAMRGCTAFAYSIATFTIYRPFEYVRDDLCYQDLPVTVVGIGAGVTYAALGGTHHAQEDVAVMGAIPNMSIIAPCDPLETAAAAWVCADLQGPAYLRLGKAGEPALTSEACDPFVFGTVRYIQRGEDVCILSYGPIMAMAFELARTLEATGRTVSVVSVHTLKPLDRSGVAEALRHHGEVVVIEEHAPRGGLGADVKQIAWEERATCRLYTFSLRDQFMHFFGSQREFLKMHGLDPDLMASAIVRGASDVVSV